MVSGCSNAMSSENLISCCQRSDSNCAPQSVVIVDGTPKRAIQLETNACATVIAVMLGIGMASGHRVKRSIQVKRYTNPWHEGRGPTRSRWTWSKRASGVAYYHLQYTIAYHSTELDVWSFYLSNESSVSRGAGLTWS